MDPLEGLTNGRYTHRAAFGRDVLCPERLPCLSQRLGFRLRPSFFVASVPAHFPGILGVPRCLRLCLCATDGLR